MPYRIRRIRVRTGRKVGRSASRRPGSAVRRQVHQTDVERVLFSTDIAPATAHYNPDWAFNATEQFTTGFQPLSAFNADAKYTTYISKMWNQYKILKVGYQIQFYGGDDASILAEGKPINFVYAWDRTTTWAAAALTGKTTMGAVAGMSGSQYGQWVLGQPCIISTAISDVRSSQDGWLDTSALPGTAPNTGQYFCPGLYIYGMEDGAVNTKKISVSVKMTMEIALRGVKLDQ